MDIEQEKDIFNIIEDLEKKASTSNSFRLATLSLMKAKTCYARKRRANDEYTDILVGDSQDKYMNRLNYERNLPRTNPKNFGVLHMPTNREHKVFISNNVFIIYIILLFIYHNFNDNHYKIMELSLI